MGTIVIEWESTAIVSEGHIAIGQSYFPWHMKSAIRSPIINTVGLIGARTRVGMIEASTTRNPSRPWTLPY